MCYQLPILPVNIPCQAINTINYSSKSLCFVTFAHPFMMVLRFLKIIQFSERTYVFSFLPLAMGVGIIPLFPVGCMIQTVLFGNWNVLHVVRVCSLCRTVCF